MLGRALIKHYHNLQGRYSIMTDHTYGNLVVPNCNSEEAVHRWFHVKEGFSSRLLKHVLKDTGLSRLPHLSLLDSFAGGGTTVVSALSRNDNIQPWPVTAYGIECNPFLRFVAETKVRSLRFGAPNFRQYIRNTVNLCQSSNVTAGEAPKLSTFHRDEYFGPDTMAQLLRLRSAIEMTTGTDMEKDLAKLCLAGTIEPVSALRRDGRALRHVPGKHRPNVLDEFLKRASIIASDVDSCSACPRMGHVYLGDGRRPADSLPSRLRFDLILFSPPYPNTIDYTEVYKLEAWFLGFLRDKGSFRSQRLLTLRSHPSVRFPEYYYAGANGYKPEFDALMSTLLREIPRNEKQSWRRRLVVGYFDDMLQTLHNHKGLLADHGRLVFVVGNSVHGRKEERFLIAADLLIARLAEMVGYEVESFVVARQLKRRGLDLPLMRESVVFLRKKE